VLACLYGFAAAAGFVSNLYGCVVKRLHSLGRELMRRKESFITNDDDSNNNKNNRNNSCDLTEMSRCQPAESRALAAFKTTTTTTTKEDTKPTETEAST
jgi:hypothetical protein